MKPTVEWGDKENSVHVKNEDGISEELVKFMENASCQFRMSGRPHYCYNIYYKRHTDDLTIEYLPVLALLLKQVSKKYPDVIFSLEEMKCQDEYVNCLLEFNSDCDISDITDIYKDTIEITRVNQSA